MVLATAACSGGKAVSPTTTTGSSVTTTQQPAAPLGTVSGKFGAVGGASRGRFRPLHGQVTLAGQGGRVFTANVGGSGNWTLRVPAGDYSATGRSPEYNSGMAVCRAPRLVSVTAGRTVHNVVIVCEMK